MMPEQAWNVKMGQVTCTAGQVGSYIHLKEHKYNDPIKNKQNSLCTFS